MAKCDEGYLCEVCGEEVEGIGQSDLYLRFVIGEMDPELLHTSPERHLRCNPVLTQFIRDERFCLEADVPTDFSLSNLDETYVEDRIELVTRGWRRLQELAALDEELPIYDYPLPEARDKWK